MSDVPHIVFLCRTPSKLERVIVHLKKVGFKPVTFTSVKAAITFMLKEQPKFIFVSWNYHPQPKKFLRTLNKTFSVNCIPLAESSDRTTSINITRSGFKDIVLYPASGETVLRIIERRKASQEKRDTGGTQSLSKIQIRVDANDVPPDGEWEPIPGKAKAWYFQTDVALKIFGKKNGRFIYQGDNIPERKINGKWNIDSKKGKLDFEILNVIEEGPETPIMEPLRQAILTEEEAAQKITNALGMSLEQIEIGAIRHENDGFSEEEIYQEEITKDIVLPGVEVDSVVDGIIQNLETGFLHDEEQRLKMDSKEGLAYIDPTDDNPDDLLQERGKSKQYEALEDEPEKERGYTHIKGERKEGRLSIIKGAEREKGDLIFQERKKIKTNHIQSGHDKADTQNDSTMETDEQGRYRPRIEGTKSDFALIVHASNISLKTKEAEEKADQIRDCTRLGIITITSRIYKGYFVCATGNNKRADLDRLEQIREMLSNTLMAEGHGPREMLVAEVEIPSINFKSWIKKHAVFVSYVQVGADEVAIGFIDADGYIPDFQIKAEKMVPVPLRTIQPNTALDFDMYLYLQKNDKYILYVKRHDMFFERQVLKENSSVQVCYLKAEHVDYYRIYCAKIFIISRAEENKKTKAS